ncbi:DUF7948 domain-containing protein [Foetidibacter luteolus]|uniref:DUF7948 domain-containing protein n=1 Tax=Foetidibacter luteolus TaxID=2608880 RepID=UPI00129B105B|nr:PKD domain-containing protein [Foetidibacter luteolus]
MKIFSRIATLLVLFAWKNTLSQSIEFIENKGQWDSRVHFKGDLNGGSFFLTSTGYKVVLNNQEDMRRIAEYAHSHADTGAAAARLPQAGPKDYKLRSHAYEMKFINASANAQVIPEKPLNTAANYFIGKDPSKWSANCQVYQAVLYKNIYPNVDIRYYMDGSYLKYDLIVNPGGDVERIALQFEGAEKLELKNQSLVIKTTAGEVSELKPYSFQAGQTGRMEVSSKYSVKNNIVKFKVDNYDKTKTLVIDPTLVFSTFAGSTVDNWGYTATYDGEGNFYGGGIVFGTGFPVSTGSFDTDYSGGGANEDVPACDIGIIKLSPNGTRRLYATYLGGTGNEQPHSLVVDNNGDLIVAGRTSSADFPTTVAKFGAGNQGGAKTEDIFIAKISADGSRLVGSRLFGGSGRDGVNIKPKYESSSVQGATSINRNYGDDARSEVIVDGQNNIYLASCTQSDDFPTTANAFQKSRGGKQDGVFIKTNPNLNTVITSTFLGGTEDDAAFVLAINPLDNNVYIGGATVSNNLPGVGAGGVLFSGYQGGLCDGFVSIINNSTGALVKSTYVGTNGNDLVYGVQFDKFGYPYIMGTTTGTWPVVNATFRQNNGRQFIAKLRPDISGWEYSTVFGKGQAAPDISPVAFLVDRCENVYVSGWGGGINQGGGYPNAYTNGLSVTADAIQSSTDGSDFYFFVLKKDAQSQLYGTFFGERGGLGDHVDGGTSRFDRMGVIYTAICANCDRGGVRGTFPTIPGNVWSPSNPATTASRCNLGMVKIAFELAGIGTGVRSSIQGVIRDKVGCIPLRVDFTDTIAIAKQYIWDFGDGSPRITTTIPSASYTYNNVGTYNVMLIAVDSSSCNVADTSYVQIQAKDNKANLGFTRRKVGLCESLEYEFTNTSTATLPFNSKSFVWDFGDGVTDTAGMEAVNHTYAAPGTYQVILNLIDTNYCNYPDADTINLRIAANVVAQFTTPPFGCAPYTAVFENTSFGGHDFLWDFGDGSPTSTEESPEHLYTTPGNYTVRLTATDTSTCNKVHDTTFTVIVSPKPTASFTYTPTSPKENTPYVFTNTSTGATRYKWFFGDGDSLNTIRRDTVVSHIYNESGNYRVSLVAYNQYGCTDTFSVTVQAIVVPLVDVPNAFTPNGDGINDHVTVRGYGISKLAWRIFNRWGTLVYGGNSQKIGWDGKYKGVLQPQEVYTYVLDVEFTDGTKFQKRGDITLLR